jgi:hypothetical protein
MQYKRKTALIAVILSATMFFAGQAWGDLRSNLSVYQKVSGPNATPDRIVIRCRGWAEDSAAHLRLVYFDGERVVYRCRTQGY